MTKTVYSVIVGTGSYIPKNIVKNNYFRESIFYDKEKKLIDTPIDDLIGKFQKITNIDERRYADDNMVTSDIAYLAAVDAFESSGIDPESLDGIIVAHNFGDIKLNNRKSDIVPSLATRVKYRLGIKNSSTVAFDLIFGCPGWLQGIITANCRIRSGDAKRIMVIGAETLSRVSDPYDRDSMIYSDGAGATIIEACHSEIPTGILSHVARTDALSEATFLEMKESYSPEYTGNELYLKMQGRKLYEYAINNVPELVSRCIEKANIGINQIKKILIHQANEKMDEAIVQRLFKSYGIYCVPDGIMPMTINKLGNSSVATLPTLLDLITKNKLDNHSFSKDDYVIFASVGAGMNINAFAYKF